MPAVPFAVGADFTSTVINNYFDWTAKTVQQKSDIIRNANTAFLDSVDLVIPVTAGFTYSFESVLLYDTSAAADVQIRLSYPSGSTGWITNFGSGTAITTATNAINQQATAISGTSMTQVYGGVSIGTILAVTPSGGITAGATGNLVIGFAQNTSAAVNSLLKQWSWMRVARTA